MKKVVVAAIVIGLLIFAYWYQQVDRSPDEIMVVPEPLVVEEKPAPPPEPPQKTVVQPPAPPPPPPPAKKPAPPPVLEAPQVEIFEELIPENIEIIRVYYSHPIIGPGSTLRFDINGSGFNEQFEKMISVKSGNEDVAVTDFKLITPNQISGSLVIDKKTKTSVNFPQVLIQGKVVFQAPEPYAVIREGEVLNLIFVEMAPSGRAGKFRVFTNLTPELFDLFKVISSTDGIEATNMVPRLPYTVDGDLTIGWKVPMGTYDLSAYVRQNKVWEGTNIIRIVRPNVGQSGLAQRIKTLDGWHRPRDVAKFEIQGSGFRPQDAELLAVKIDGMENFISSFTFIAPGRMGLQVTIPKNAKANTYSLAIHEGENELLKVEKAFSVVGKDWARDLTLEPALPPGSIAKLVLRGRAMTKKFVSKIQIETDDPGLAVGPFVLESPERAVSQITAKDSVSPGDYWLKMTANGKPVQPQFGSIIKVSPQ